MWYVWTSFVISQVLLAWFIVIPILKESGIATVKTCSVIRWSLAKYKVKGKNITPKLWVKVVCYGFHMWFFTFFGESITRIGSGETGGLWYGVGDWRAWHDGNVIGKSATLDRQDREHQTEGEDE